MIPAITLAEKLLTVGYNPTVAIITPYLAQKIALETALANMVVDKVSGVDRLHMGTADSLIGQEFNHVILAMPM